MLFVAYKNESIEDGGIRKEGNWIEVGSGLYNICNLYVSGSFPVP